VHDTLDSLNGNCQKQDCTHWHNYTLLSWHIQLTASRKKQKKNKLQQITRIIKKYASDLPYDIYVLKNSSSCSVVVQKPCDVVHHNHRYTKPTKIPSFHYKLICCHYTFPINHTSFFLHNAQQYNNWRLHVNNHKIKK